jgi:hypothetical protein
MLLLEALHLRIKDIDTDRDCVARIRHSGGDAGLPKSSGACRIVATDGRAMG